MATSADTSKDTSTKALPATTAAKPISGPGADPGTVKETTTEAVRAKSDPKQSEQSAAEQIQQTLSRWNRGMVGFFVKYGAAMFAVFLTAITGTLLHVDFWPSWFWMIPVIIFAMPILVEVFNNVRTKRKEKIGAIVVRRVQSLVVAIVVLVLLLVIIWSNLHLLAWYLIGNETLGSLGMIGWGMSVSPFFLGLPLSVIAGILTIVVPAVLLVQLTQRAVRDDVVMWKLLLLALGTAVAFSLPLGWSVIMYSNM